MDYPYQPQDNAPWEIPNPATDGSDDGKIPTVSGWEYVLSSGGIVPAPADPADDGKVATAGGGAVTWETPGAGASLLHQAVLTLNNAQIKAFPTAVGHDIVATPGPGKVLILKHASVVSAITDPYTNLDADPTETQFVISYSAADAINATNYLDDGSDAPDLLVGSNLLLDWPVNYQVTDGRLSPTNLSAPEDYADLPLTLICYNGSTGDFTGGNAANSLKVSITYLVLNLTTGQFE